MFASSTVRSLIAPAKAQKRFFHGFVVASALACLPLMANATPVHFTLTSSSSLLDLTATGSLSGTPLTVTEQSAGSKANKVANASGTFLETNLYPSTIQMPGANNDGAVDVQKAGFLNLPVALRPGVGGVGDPASGNYGITLAYPLDTPIALPPITIGTSSVVFSLTGVQMDVALRNLALDFDSTFTARTGGTKNQFNAQDVSVAFAAGQADMGFGAVLGFNSTGNYFGDLLLQQGLIVGLKALIPATPGFTVSIGAGPNVTSILVGTGFSQDLTTLGSLANVATASGTIDHVGSQWKLGLPVEINPASAIPSSLTSLLGLSLNLKLAGTMNATAPYVAVVPEPSTLAMAACGLVGMIGFRLRQRRGN